MNAGRPPSSFWSSRTLLDGWIPYLGWTSIVYYLGTAYIAGWGGLVLWRVRRGFRAGILAYLATILGGAAVQLLFPVRAPFPAELSAAQAAVHDFFSVRPYATFPSMHVALSVLPTAIGCQVLESRALRILSGAATLAIAVSTVTAKEHYALDVLAGAGLGMAAYVAWRVLDR